MKARRVAVACALVMAVAAPASAQDRSVGVEVGVGWASCYVWRGENVFQESSQMDQHSIFSPSLSLSFGDTGVSVGYWGAFQLNGANRGALVEEGVGAEQDFVVGYDFSIADDLAGAAAIAWYLYPLADPDVAGAPPPAYLEPRLGVVWSRGVDLGMTVAYYQGVAGLESDHYAYLSPAATHSRELTARATLDLGLALGFKAPIGDAVGDGAFDATVDVGSSIAIGERYTLAPAAHVAWTNFDGVSFGDEWVVWASVDLAASL